MSASRVQGIGANTGGSGGTGGYASTVSATYASAVAAGNLLTAIVYWVDTTAGGPITFTIADTLSNTWIAGPSGLKANYHGQFAMWYCVSKSAGTNQVTITPSVSGEMGMMVDEWNAGGNAVFIYQGGSVVDNASSPYSTANLTLSGAGPTWLLAGYILTLYQASTITAESGYTAGSSYNSTPGFSYLSQYQFASSSASGSPMTATMTNGAGQEGLIGAIVFEVLPYTMLPPLSVRDRSQSRRRLLAD
jgi:hypothetical protein